MSRVFAHDLISEGGSWLAEAREYLLQHAPNGDHLIWGSHQPITLSIREIEELAACVAAKAINEDRKNPNTQTLSFSEK